MDILCVLTCFESVDRNYSCKKIELAMIEGISKVILNSCWQSFSWSRSKQWWCRPWTISCGCWWIMHHRPDAYLQAKLWDPQSETEQWKDVANSTKQKNAVRADVGIQNSASATKGLGKLTLYGKIFSCRVWQPQNWNTLHMQKSNVFFPTLSLINDIHGILNKNGRDKQSKHSTVFLD